MYESDRGTSEDRFDIRDDYFTKDTPQKKAPLKRNSAGNLPPDRPPISPIIQRKTSGKSSNSLSKKDRPPADDLFDKDFVVVSSQTKRSVSLSPRPLRKAETAIQTRASVKQEVLKPPTTVTPPNTVSHKGRVKHIIGDPYLTLPYHLAIALVLYLYYTFNPWSYLSGLLAGFLLTYTLVGTVFILYVESTEQEREERKKERNKLKKPSKHFLQRMSTDFSNLKEYKVLSLLCMHVFVYSNTSVDLYRQSLINFQMCVCHI